MLPWMYLWTKKSQLHFTSYPYPKSGWGPRTRLGGGPRSPSVDLFARTHNFSPPLFASHLPTAPTLAQLFAYEQICDGPTLAAKDGPTIKLWLAQRWATDKLLSGYRSLSVFLNARLLRNIYQIDNWVISQLTDIILYLYFRAWLLEGYA